MAYHIIDGKLYDENGKPVTVDRNGHLSDGGSLLDPFPSSDWGSLNPLGLLDNVPGVGGAVDAIGDTGQAAVSAGKAIVSAAEWMKDRDNWFRVLKVILGAGMILGGLNLMLDTKVLSSPAVGQVIKAVA